MPKEDSSDAIQSCYVDLTEKIRDVTWLSRCLYQFKILNEHDLEEISSHSKRSDCNAAFLDILPRRGNVFDFVIKIMQGKREYQDAAVILQKHQISLAHV